jgi:hypothetical protein
MLPEDSGLVGTPYFWAGMAAVIGIWLLLMLAFWA